jgi:hypothetical protein
MIERRGNDREKRRKLNETWVCCVTPRSEGPSACNADRHVSRVHPSHPSSAHVASLPCSVGCQSRIVNQMG